MGLLLTDKGFQNELAAEVKEHGDIAELLSRHLGQHVSEHDVDEIKWYLQPLFDDLQSHEAVNYIHRNGDLGQILAKTNPPPPGFPPTDTGKRKT